MSDVKILTGEDITTFEPWTFPEVKLPHVLEMDEKQKREAALLHEQEMQELRESKTHDAIEQGYQEGLAKGKQEAIEEMRLQYEPLWQQKLQLLEELLQQLTTPLAMVDAELEHMLSELVMKLTRHLLQDELTNNPAQIIKLVKNALELLPTTNKNLRIYVNAQDKTLLASALSSEYLECLTEDAHMQRGECRFSSNSSELDATFDTRLAKLFTQVFHEGK